MCICLNPSQFCKYLVGLPSYAINFNQSWHYFTLTGFYSILKSSCCSMRTGSVASLNVPGLTSSTLVYCFLQRRNLQRSSTASPLVSVPAVPPRIRPLPPPRRLLRTQVTPIQAKRFLRSSPPPHFSSSTWSRGFSSTLTELTGRATAARWAGREQRPD